MLTIVGVIVVVVAAAVAIPLGIVYGSSNKDKSSLTLKVVTQSANAPVILGTPGQNNVSTLSSLEYIIERIHLCRDLTLTGTAWSNAQGCVTLYENGNAPNYNTFGPLQAIADTSDNWIDFTNATSRAKLLKSVELTEGSEFNYALTSWIRPIRYQATIPFPAGSPNPTGYSKSTSNYTACLTVGDPGCTCSTGYVAGSFFTGPAQKSVTFKDNGGSVFRMQAPLVIAKNATYEVALAFNLQHIIKLAESTRCGDLKDNGGWQMRVPFMSFAAVAFEKTAPTTTVQKETYYVNRDVGQNVIYRIELYYVSDDANKVVRAVDAQEIYTAATSGDPTPFGGIFFVTKQNDGKYTFANYAQQAMVSGLTRGVSGNVTWHCGVGFSASECPGGVAGTFPLTYDYKGVTDVSS